MNGPTTPTGRRLRDDDRQHGAFCGERRADWCQCGQTENIRFVEAEARQQERERLRARDPFGESDWNDIYRMPKRWDTPLALLLHFQEWLLAEPPEPEGAT